MAKVIDKVYVCRLASASLIGTISLIMGGFASINNRFLAGLGLFFVAVLLYFYTVLKIAEKNWLDIRAVFSGVWIGTIGLATLRLTDYQEQWLTKTWLLLAVAYLMFQVGATLGICGGEKFYLILCKYKNKVERFNISIKMQESRLYPICIVTTLIGMICFAINIKIKGFVPAFSNIMWAYQAFYTKFHVFAVAATAIAGLCYYCIKTQTLSKFKKITLWLCIFYLVILFPVLVVSRGVFIIAALSLTTTIFYLNKRKLHVFIICLIAMMGIYLFTSNLRGYTDENLDALFQPSDITIDVADSDETGEQTEQEIVETPIEQETETNLAGDDVSVDNPPSASNSGETTNELVNFSLPPKLAFLYGYLTVSHDNFNEAVENTVGYTWGARQFYPFNVILRIPKISELIGNGEIHLIRPYLTTSNMVGIFYYDFHEWGVILCTLFWSILFGVVQGYHMKSKGLFSLFILGFVMNVVALSFFESWVDSFELWMFCGVIMIVAFISCIGVKTRKVVEDSLKVE